MGFFSGRACWGDAARRNEFTGPSLCAAARPATQRRPVAPCNCRAVPGLACCPRSFLRSCAHDVAVQIEHKTTAQRRASQALRPLRPLLPLPGTSAILTHRTSHFEYSLESLALAARVRLLVRPRLHPSRSRFFLPPFFAPSLEIGLKLTNSRIRKSKRHTRLISPPAVISPGTNHILRNSTAQCHRLWLG